jgi:hypothetical protein
MDGLPYFAAKLARSVSLTSRARVFGDQPLTKWQPPGTNSPIGLVGRQRRADIVECSRKSWYGIGAASLEASVVSLALMFR